jgi:hypothetical protein
MNALASKHHWKGLFDSRVPAQRGFSARVAVCVAAAITANTALAQVEESELRSWEPALSLGFDVQNQSFTAKVDSSDLFKLVPASTSSTTVLSSLFRFDGALYTPTLLEGAGAPRLLVHGGVQIPLSGDFALLRANEEFIFIGADPSPDEACPKGELVDGNTVGTCDHASSISLDNNVNWYLGLGVEFTLPIAERQFKLRPSIDYFGQSLRFDGTAARRDRADGAGSVPEGTVLREPTVSASTDELTHAVGPRLTLDVDVARVGSFSLNVFVEAQIYWILSDRTYAFSGSNADGDTADFVVEADPLVAQGGAGLRIVWRGD